MATPITFNGVAYSVPTYEDTGYAQGAGNLQSYFIAISTGTLQPSGGSFPLTGDVNFGTNFGLIAKYYKSVAASPALTGVLRLGNAESVVWRNAANSADLALTVNSSNELQFNGATIPSGGSSFVSSITGTANQVIASAPTGAVTLSLPQSIATTSTPTFGGETLSVSGTNPARLTWANGGFSACAGVARYGGTDYFVMAEGATLPASLTDAFIAKAAVSSLIIRPGANPNNGVSLFGGSNGVSVDTLLPSVSASSAIGSPSIPFGNIYTKASLLFQETGAGTDNIAISAQASSAPYSLSLPAAQGAASQTWVNDGSGVLSWGTLPVAGGGSGTTSHIAYSVLCGGTTSTAAVQSVASVGTSGHVLTSNGAGALPTFQAVSGSGTVNAGTATHLAHYATSSTAVSDASGATINGAYTFSGGAGAITMSGSTIAMGANKITGLANGTASADAAAFGQIKVLQNVFATGTTSSSVTSSTFGATQVTGSITPTSASNRVKVTAMFMSYTPIAAGTAIYYLARGSTKLGSGSAMIQQGNSGAGVTFSTGSILISWIDSPATTSATSYTVYAKNENAVGTVTVGNGYDWSVILEEIV